MTEEAKLEKRDPFVIYLEGSPNITDTTNHVECGNARKYFGFDENFINDKQICEDIEQLKYSRDFDFLQAFFGQGADEPPGDDPPDLTPAPTPPERREVRTLDLKEPNFGE
jgi:hypothetical protein